MRDGERSWKTMTRSSWTGTSLAKKRIWSVANSADRWKTTLKRRGKWETLSPTTEAYKDFSRIGAIRNKLLLVAPLHAKTRISSRRQIKMKDVRRDRSTILSWICEIWMSEILSHSMSRRLPVTRTTILRRQIRGRWGVLRSQRAPIDSADVADTRLKSKGTAATFPSICLIKWIKCMAQKPTKSRTK